MSELQQVHQSLGGPQHVPTVFLLLTRQCHNVMAMETFNCFHKPADASKEKHCEHLCASMSGDVASSDGKSASCVK